MDQPQLDLPRALTGGSDRWDELAGQLVAAEFFEAALPTIAGTLAATEAGADSFAAAGTVGSTGITGALAASETGADTAAGAGAVLPGAGMG